MIAIRPSSAPIRGTVVAVAVSANLDSARSVRASWTCSGCAAPSVVRQGASKLASSGGRGGYRPLAARPTARDRGDVSLPVDAAVPNGSDADRSESGEAETLGGKMMIEIWEPRLT